jgi:prepilin-type N-terminal cleavage/methylation domain-containing protein
MRLSKGFSLIELLVALSVTMLLASMMFQLFHQNERVLRDQTLIMEMQQTARIVISQIADEIRMAGQGVPVYATASDAAPSEAAAVILGSSGSSRIDFRAGLSNIETAGLGAADFSLNTSQTMAVVSASGFASGRFVYIFGPTATRHWTWLRAELTSMSSTSLTLTPRNGGAADTAFHFTSAPTITLEEAVSIYSSGSSVRRATATNMTDLTSPVWSAANEIGKNITALSFMYYDVSGNTIQPTSLANRVAIARIDIQLTVQSANRLSDGRLPTYSLALRTIPRNIRTP